jgi:hypothetical protein
MPGDDDPTTARGRFPVALGAIVVLAVAVRTVYVLVLTRHVTLGADATWYYLQSGLLRHGIGYVDPRTFFADGRAVATGAWPPLYPAYLSLVVRWIGDSETTLRLAGLLPAAITVALTGVLGRRVVRDDRVALLGALIVALLPFAIANDMAMMSETLSVPFTLGVLIAGHAIIRHPVAPWRYAVLGAVAALGALARSDVLITALVVIVVVFVTVRVPTSRALTGLATAAIAIALVLAPWALRNHARVGTYAITTTSYATAIAGSNCSNTYGGRDLGSWSFECIHFDARTADNELAWSHRITRLGRNYATHHISRWPIVVPARVARAWGVWSPQRLAHDESVETRRQGWQLAAWLVELPVFVFAAAAVVAHRRRVRDIAILLAAPVAITVTAVVTYGNQRFRAPAEPSLALLAAWAACALAHRRTRAQTR